MPELPDVEIMLQKARPSLHKKIKKVEVKDETVLDNAPKTLRKHVEGRSLDWLERIGKNIFVKIEGDQSLHMHFGMTGDLAFVENGEEPEYSQIVFHFGEGSALHYISKRKFGSVAVIEDIGTLVDEKELGRDAANMSKKEFKEALGGKRGMVKTALTDQKTIAGIGNVYADEILYQSQIHPKTKVDDLTDEQLEDLYTNMNRIFKTSINNDAEPEKMPDHYLNTHRNEGEDCPDCSGQIERIKVSGRSTYLCPNCQTVNS